MNKKTLVLTALMLISTARAYAGIQGLSLPAMPLNVPSRVGPHDISLPSMTPTAPLALPAYRLPVVVVGEPRITLPGPAYPKPLKPTAVFSTFLKAGEIKVGALKEQKAAEKLDRLFDKGDHRVNTLPENDLLDEIGVQ